MVIIGEKVKNYSAICSLIMMVLIYNSVNELELYNKAFNQRQYVSELHGHFVPSYANKFSHITSCLIFICNFGVFMIYFQLGLMSWSFSLSFQLPLILQFIILFIYQNRMLIIQLKIKAMDLYSQNMR